MFAKLDKDEALRAKVLDRMNRDAEYGGVGAAGFSFSQGAIFALVGHRGLGYFERVRSS